MAMEQAHPGAGTLRTILWVACRGVCSHCEESVELIPLIREALLVTRKSMPLARQRAVTAPPRPVR
jgi:hypothetical protein